jgi:high affinity Mn2+ porin
MLIRSKYPKETASLDHPKNTGRCAFFRHVLCVILMGGLGSAIPGYAQGAAPVPSLQATTDKPKEVPKESVNGFQEFLGLSESWSVYTQATYIDQWHYRFRSLYEGPNSLRNKSEFEHTFSYTLYLDRKLWHGAEVVYNPELFQGHGLSQTLGVAGFPNGEAVKSGFAQLHYNTSRAFIRQVIGLGGEKESIERDLNQIAQPLDVSRLTFTFGKVSAGDFFDGNAFSHDPRTQFMNWSMWESSAWDYPADVVGFTVGGVAEYNTKYTTLHYGVFMEPLEPNSPTFDQHLTKAYGQILQFDYRYTLDGHAGTIRSFVFRNRGLMGEFESATVIALVNGTAADASQNRRYRLKVGGGLSWDQEITTDLGAFLRLSMADGRNEAWAFTQVDRSIAAGVSLKGTLWHRTQDTLGAAFSVDGLSAQQRAYLAAGGTGLIIGDGALNYHPEQIFETYYAYQPRRWLQFSVDYQSIKNPGYNSDRGPVSFYAVRSRVQF